MADAIEERLEESAAEAFELSRSLCNGCRTYHGIWSYRRLAGDTRGGGHDAAIVGPLLWEELARGGRRVLIAGSADTGLPAMVLNTCPGVELTIVDRCGTPIEICRRFSQRSGARFSAIQRDLRDSEPLPPADLVLAHGLLASLAAPDRPVVLANLARALAPDGRLLLAMRISVGGQDRMLSSMEETANDRWQKMLLGFSARGIAVPGDGTELRDLVTAETPWRLERDRLMPTREQAAALVADAGFAVERVVELPARGADGPAAAAARRVRPGVVLVCRRA